MAACYNLADALRRGRDVPIDLARARQLYLKACRRKDSISCKDYALMLVDGIGGPRDEAQAATLLAQECEGGLWQACRASGRLFERSPALRNLPRAVTFYRRACAAGARESCAAAKRLDMPKK